MQRLKILNTLSYLLNKFIIFKKNKYILKNYNPLKIVSKKKAILYYKYQSFNEIFFNNEISTRSFPLIIARILNQYGYKVTIVDRNFKNLIDLNQFDVILGVINVGSANLFLRTLLANKKLDKNKKIIGISTGAEASVIRDYFLRSLSNFNLRNNCNLTSIHRFSDDKYTDAKKKIQYLFYHGYKNGFVHDSYKKYEIKKYNLITPIEELPINLEEIKLKKINNKNFVFFSGSGFIHKGLDIVIEIFKKNQNLNLFVFILRSEKDFEEFYDIKNIKNVKYYVNININDNFVKNIFLNSTFLLSPTCSGGSSASIAQAMRYGLIPITSKNEDNNQSASLVIEHNNISSLENTIHKSMKIDYKRLKYLSIENHKLSYENSLDNYKQLLKNGFDEIFTNK